MVVPESEGHHSFSCSLKIYLLRFCYVPGTILSPREADIPSLMEPAFWQRRQAMNKEINTDAFQGSCVLCRRRTGRWEGWC